MYPGRNVRGRIVPLIEAWQKISILAERIIRKREAAAVRIPPNLRPTYLPTHFFSSSAPSSPTSSSSTSNNRLLSSSASVSSYDSTRSRTSNFLHGLAPAAIFASGHGLPSANTASSDVQADLARLTNTFKVLVEVNGQCWRGGEECELSEGVKRGVKSVAEHTQRETDLLEQRVCDLSV